MAHHFLTVGYRDASYAIDAEMVQEIVWLPELSAIEEQPPYIRGLFNLRGRVIPVIDLGQRFGYSLEPQALHHRVVVIEKDSRQVGVIVHELHDMVAVDPDEIERVDNFQLPGSEARYIRGVLKQEDRLLLLLDFESILHDAADAVVVTPDLSCTEPEEEKSRVLHNRAMELAVIPADDDAGEMVTLALIRLGGEIFGIKVSEVGEFVRLQELAPIPCSPSHVAGNMILRGDILPVMDVSTLLGLQVTPTPTEVVVVRVEASSFGIITDAVEDVVSVDAGLLIQPSEATSAQSVELCAGVASIDDRLVSVIDMGKLFSELKRRTELVSHPPV